MREGPSFRGSTGSSVALGHAHQASEDFAVFDGRTLQRTNSGLNAVADEVFNNGYDCICVGEVHDDPVAHAVELELLQLLSSRCKEKGRPFSLSLEFFERDAQTVMDEYLAGLCRESDLVKDGRAWSNYADYRPLVELCKDQGIPLVCANAARRHVSLAGREGAESLGRLPESSKSYLPPLPISPGSSSYKEKLFWLLRSSRESSLSSASTEPGRPDTSDSSPSQSGSREERVVRDSSVETAAECPYIGFKQSSKFFDAQCLWDASMAQSVHQALSSSDGSPLVLHVCGKFHCENHLGIPERLSEMYLPADNCYDACIAAARVENGETVKSRPVKTLVLCVIPARRGLVDSDLLPETAGGIADYVILSDSSLPRSFEIKHSV
mmetsp:Transcript_21142/g.50485  ORF Transcript_21142/g.50485 Transcript_21142/m.50485 type:complete len:382 (+) Transcript_21142:621-1766(+)